MKVLGCQHKEDDGNRVERAVKGGRGPASPCGAFSTQVMATSRDLPPRG